MDRRRCNRDGILTCACCNRHARETRDHLFFGCDFSINCWRKIGLDWTSLGPDPPFMTYIRYSKNCMHKDLYKEIFLSAAWEFWKCRNDLIFNNVTSTVQAWLLKFKVSLRNQSSPLTRSSARSIRWGWISSGF
ncbi:hypothetical protein BRADI_2g47258v3 [Brachypodium distachyon]|uniref:Reverse transcriptase zinc-binding domain-containing protein n=1 Tax=Brachypodium distachyon TaxID=15368 RepID=A0A2K2DEA0_BRADI|nr:hypothetical protein BRADI_2g47258v3 [Brachypodium distachyon]